MNTLYYFKKNNKYENENENILKLSKNKEFCEK